MKLGSEGKLRSVSDAEIVQKEEYRKVREWGEMKSVSDAEIVQEAECCKVRE